MALENLPRRFAANRISSPSFLRSDRINSLNGTGRFSDVLGITLEDLVGIITRSGEMVLDPELRTNLANVYESLRGGMLSTLYSRYVWDFVLPEMERVGNVWRIEMGDVNAGRNVNKLAEIVSLRCDLI